MNRRSLLKFLSAVPLANFAGVSVIDAWSEPQNFNDENTRQQIKAILDGHYQKIQTQKGIYDYMVICDTSNNTDETVNANELVLDIYIKHEQNDLFDRHTINAIDASIFW